MKFDFEDTGFDRYWHGGSPFRSLFWSQMSTAFEPGEKFFIDSARALRGAIQDPQLLEELQEFCRQEGQHTAQHLKFDRVNAALGLDLERCRARYTNLLQSTREELDPIAALAITVALEHFTACFADQYFGRPEMSAGADPNVNALWAWHAAEESEHRATCFDIFRAAGGSYPRRVFALLVSWSFFLTLSMINTAELLHRDGKLFTRDTLSGLGYLFGRRGVLTGLVPALVAYLNPRFHPWKGVDSSAIARWRAENAQYIQNPTNEAA